MARRCEAGGALAIGAWLLTCLPGAAGSSVLPPRDQFLKEVAARLKADQTILQQYSYTRTVEQRERDGAGHVTETRRHVYEVWPLPDDPEGFRITLVRDNEPRPADDVARQRAEYRARLARVESRRAGESAADRSRRERREAEARQQTADMIADVRSVFDVALMRRETVNGVPSILVTFRPRADARPRTREGQLLTKVAGRAWFSETDYELVRVDAAAIAPIRYGWGILARIDPGARAVIDRQRLDEGAWVPARYELSASGRLLLVKGLHRDATVWFTNLRPVRQP